MSKSSKYLTYLKGIRIRKYWKIESFIQFVIHKSLRKERIL